MRHWPACTLWWANLTQCSRHWSRHAVSSLYSWISRQQCSICRCPVRTQVCTKQQTWFNPLTESHLWTLARAFPLRSRSPSQRSSNSRINRSLICTVSLHRYVKRTICWKSRHARVTIRQASCKQRFKSLNNGWSAESSSSKTSARQFHQDWSEAFH